MLVTDYKYQISGKPKFSDKKLLNLHLEEPFYEYRSFPIISSQLKIDGLPFISNPYFV